MFIILSIQFTVVIDWCIEILEYIELFPIDARLSLEEMYCRSDKEDDEE